MRILAAMLVMLACAQAGAQGLAKCQDAAGKVTYASQSCEELGLKPAGEIRDRTNVAPAYKAPPPAPAAAPKPPVAAKAPAPAAAEPKQERRCFTVQTSKGTATRCNDVPDKD